MNNFFVHWKTTLAGVAAILGALTDVVSAASQGNLSGHLPADITAVITGIGLVYAADASVVVTK